MKAKNKRTEAGQPDTKRPAVGRKTSHACPDAANPVVFEIIRIYEG